MRTCIAIILLVLIKSISIFSQQNPEISNIKLEFNEGTLNIQYDILHSDPEDIFKVWLVISNSKGKEIKAQAFEGDIGERINGGGNKSITWYPDKDNVYLDEEISVLVKAMKEPGISEESPEKTGKTATYSTGNILLTSTVLPGWGLSKIHKKPYWILGIVSYGLIAGSVYLNQEAADYYDEYLRTFDVTAEENDEMYYKATDYDMYSKVCVYTCAGIWAGNIIWAVLKNRSLKQYSFRRDDYRIAPHLQINHNAAMLSLTYTF